MECVIVRNNDELYHHGVKGQKWGIRRYQKKDGSLTMLGRHRYKTDKEFKKTIDRQKALEKARASKEAKKTVEEKRAELLKSVDPKKLYENKDLLTTQELNERILRIDTEARLAGKIPEQKTGMDAANDRMNKVASTLNNATNMFQKVDNAYSTVTKSAIGKTLAKQLGIEPPKKDFSYEDFMKNISKKSNQEVADVAKRAINETLLKKNIKDLKNATNAESSSAYERAKKQVDDYVNSGAKDDRVTSDQTYTYSKKGSDITDSKVGTGNKNTNSHLRLEQVERYEATGKDVIGKGTSKFTGWKTDSVPKDVAYDGERYVESLLRLEDKGGK